MKNLNLAVGVTLKDKLSTGIKQISGNVDRATGSMRGMSGVMSTLGSKLDQLRDKARAAAEPFAKLKEQGDSLQSGGFNMALKGAAAVGVTVAPTFQAMNFEAALGEVATLTDMSVQELKKKYGSQILKLAADLGQDEGTVVSAMYQAISAGVSSDNVVGFLRDAGRSAIAGVTDVLTTTDLGTTIKNAFGVADTDMGKVWDVVFQTVKMGKTDVKQIAANFAQVGSSAAVAGVSLENVQATVAQLTLSGNQTSVAYTKIANTIAALSAPTDSAKKAFSRLGVVVNAETLKNNDLVGTLGQIADKVQTLPFKQQAEYIADMFGDKESQNLFKDFMSNRAAYENMVGSMKNSSGAASGAADKMMSTSRMAYNQLKQELRNVTIEVGDKLLPVMVSGVQHVKAFLGPVVDLARAHPQLATGIVATVAGAGALMVTLGTLGMVAGTVMKGFATYGTILEGVKDGWGKVSNAVSTFKKINVTGVIKNINGSLVRTLGIQKAMDAIRYRGGFFNAVRYQAMLTRYKMLEASGSFKAWTAAQAGSVRTNLLTVTGLRNIAKTAGGGLVSGLKAGAMAMRAMSLAFITSPVGLAVAGIALAAGLIYKYWGPISGFFKGLWTGITQAMAPIMPQVRAVGAVFMAVLNPIITPLKAIYGWIKNLIKPVDDVGGAAQNLGVRWGQVIGGMLSAVLGLPLKMFQAGANIVKSIVGGIQSVATAPVKAVTGIVQKVRNLLPFSPAKAGPLTDIHRIKLIETVAGSIKPDSLVKKVSGVMSAVRPELEGGQAINPAAVMSKSVAVKGQAAPSGGAGGSVVINYNPQVTVQGGGADIKAQVMAALKEHAADLQKLMNNQKAQTARLEY